MGWDFDEIEEFPTVFENDEQLAKFLENADPELIEDNMGSILKNKKKKNGRRKSRRNTTRISNSNVGV